MADVLIDIQVWCSKCGKGICDNVSQDKKRIGHIHIDPCKYCLKNSFDEGYEEGLRDTE